MAEREIDYQRVYRAVPMFADLTEAELDAILQIARLFRAAEGTVLLRQGQSGSGMFIVVNGTARVTARGVDGLETTLAVLERGDTVGELHLIDQAPHSATVTCAELCTLLQVDTEGFNRLRAAHHPAVYKVLRATAPMICERLRAINERIAAIFADPEKSLAEMGRAAGETR